MSFSREEDPTRKTKTEEVTEKISEGSQATELQKHDLRQTDGRTETRTTSEHITRFTRR